MRLIQGICFKYFHCQNYEGQSFQARKNLETCEAQLLCKGGTELLNTFYEKQRSGQMTVSNAWESQKTVERRSLCLYLNLAINKYSGHRKRRKNHSVFPLSANSLGYFFQKTRLVPDKALQKLCQKIGKCHILSNLNPNCELRACYFAKNERDHEFPIVFWKYLEQLIFSILLDRCSRVCKVNPPLATIKTTGLELCSSGFVHFEQLFFLTLNAHFDSGKNNHKDF